ncbi:MAG: type II toxin-antitoxin system YafQ family toxin [Bacteroidaceae bacterium]|nr:type II toxin-antitoxin system YafQ family toxin [Bacteroidaceae bacterium]
MFTLKITSQFKKDLKRIQNKPDKIIHLKEVLLLLEEEGMLPEKYKPHKLVGDYAGFMECHIENDLLLIWLDPEENIIKLVRLGTHSELFK